ncbi:calcium/calmodulin dependent protein kinase II Association-domain containing protein [Nitzschia inconspicua]|uniref:Calcium/calmodulin dependent protein kinase II Association-domain containing protein n=1 Tax=Nitzschia inconspicua TaxID=303405 RepID=A0A9K3LCC4_9STRA|nr:calcium/calmodulin dependent protein kinase II Association-domain containing protein [Nitzschia inconspicua]
MTVPPEATAGDFHPLSQSFSSLENDTALKELSEAFGSSLSWSWSSSSSSSSGDDSNNIKHQKAQRHPTNQNRPMTHPSQPKQKQEGEEEALENDSEPFDMHTGTNDRTSKTLDDERQSTSALLQVMASLERDAIHDIQQALHETSTVLASSSSSYSSQHSIKRLEATIESSNGRQNYSTSWNDNNEKAVNTIPSLSSSSCSPPSDLFPMEDDSISITDSYVFHRTIKEKKNSRQNTNNRNECPSNDKIDVEEDDDDVDSTIQALRQQVEFLDGLLDDINLLRRNPNGDSQEDGLEEDISKLEQCELLIQQEIQAIDRVLWMSPFGMGGDADQHASIVEDRHEGEASDSGTDGNNEGTVTPTPREPADELEGQSQEDRLHIEHGTEETIREVSFEESTSVTESKVGDRDHGEIDLLPKKSFPADQDLQQLQERMQQEQDQIPEARDEMPETRDCRSCEEIVAVASAGWFDFQALQQALPWGKSTDTKQNVLLNIQMDSKLPSTKGTENDPEIDAAPIVKSATGDSQQISPSYLEQKFNQESINPISVQEKGEEINIGEDVNLSDDVPKRILVPHPTSTTKSPSSLENITLFLDGVSSSGTMESNLESTDEKEKDDRIKQLAADNSAHAQASLLAITSMARGLDNKAPPKRGIPIQSTIPNKCHTISPSTQSTSGTNAAVLCGAESNSSLSAINREPQVEHSRMENEEKLHYNIPQDHLKLYQDADNLLADNGGNANQKTSGTHAFHTVVSPMICEMATKEMLIILQNAQLSEKNSCVDDCKDIGEGIEQTMSRFLEENCMDMDNLNGSTEEITSPTSRHTVTSLSDHAFDEQSSCDDSEDDRRMPKSDTDTYLHVPSMEQTKNSSPRKAMPVSMGSLHPIEFMCNQQTSSNEAASDRMSRLLQRRPQQLSEAFVAEFQSENSSDSGSLESTKADRTQIGVGKEKIMWMDEDVDNLPDTPVFILQEEPSFGQGSIHDDKISKGGTSGQHMDKIEECPLVRKWPSNETELRGVRTSTNPFEETFNYSQWMQNRRHRESLQFTPFDESFHQTNPVNDDSQSSMESIENTMTTTTTSADQSNLDFELDFASDVEPIIISPSSSHVNEKRGDIPALESLMSSPRNINSSPSDELHHVRSSLRRCSSDEGWEAQKTLSTDRAKGVLSSFIKAIKNTKGVPWDEKGLALSPSKVSTFFGEARSPFDTKSPSRRGKVGQSARTKLSPERNIRQKLTVLKDAMTSPIPVLRSPASIREEKSTESNGHDADGDNTLNDVMDRSIRSLLEAPTEENWHVTPNEDTLSQDEEIQQTLSRIAARLQSRPWPNRPSTERTEIQKKGMGYGDPLYDCVDCICGDEDVNILQKIHIQGVENPQSEELEKVTTIGSACRILSANNSGDTGGGGFFVASTASADDKIRVIGIHVTCISHKFPTASAALQPSDETDQADDSLTTRSKVDEGVFRNDEQQSQEKTDDTDGFPIDDDNYYPYVIPKSISFVDPPSAMTAGLGRNHRNACISDGTDIVKAVSYHDGFDTDRLLEGHPVQASLWTEVQESRHKTRGESSFAGSNTSCIIADTGAGRDPERYCESIETSNCDESASTTTTTTNTTVCRSDQSSHHSQTKTRRYDEIVQTLLTKTQQLLDAMLKFDYLEYSSLTTDDITGIQIDGRFLQGRSFHSYFGKKATGNALITSGKKKKTTTSATTTSSSASFLDQFPIQQSISSPTVRLVSSQVAVVSYKVTRKILERGRIVESEIYETRVWEHRPGYQGQATSDKIEDAWLNCHYHVSAVDPTAAASSTSNRRSSVTSLSAGKKSSNSSSSIPHLDMQ